MRIFPAYLGRSSKRQGSKRYRDTRRRGESPVIASVRIVHGTEMGAGV